MGSSFGKLFRITTWGESHGPAIGVVVDGCPPGIELNEEHLQVELDRRRPGQSHITTQRQEKDLAKILSGTFEGKTTGTPIHIQVDNQDSKSKDYEEMKTKYRPSHADYSYEAKYGIRDWRGGGRSSARETVGRVAAGAIASRILIENSNTQVISYVKEIKDISAIIKPETLTRKLVESHITRCPDINAAEKMVNEIELARKKGDSLGGIVESIVLNVPLGLGDPVFDKLEADLAKGLLSLPACRGFEVGSGFAGAKMTGSTHNDSFFIEKSRVRTRTNQSGGIQGGISNGENIIVRAAFKPTATILRDQSTVDINGNEVVLKPKGRHDPCVVPRAVPLVDSMINIVLVDHLLRQRAQKITNLL